MIELSPDRLNQPLQPLYAGLLSSLVVEVAASAVPDDVESVRILFERTDDADGNDRTPVAVAATLTDAGAYRAYCSPFCFPDTSETLHYHVMGTDTNGNPRWLGSGQLRVRENPANGSAVEPEVIPSDTYIRNPTTGLYHKLTAFVDEYGEVSVSVAEEGIER